MVSVPLVVTTSAVYRFSGSMTIGGGPSKRWVFGLEPSAAGISGVMAPVPRVVCGGMGVVRPEVGVAGRRAGPGRAGQDSVTVTDTMRWRVMGVPVLLEATEPPALIFSTTSMPEVTFPNSV